MMIELRDEAHVRRTHVASDRLVGQAGEQTGSMVK
jgi:hypothetical protein